jgi:hypothetical protein
MKTLLTFTFCLWASCFLSLQVSAQRHTMMASSDCRQVISVDLGVHRVFVDGPYGGHFGFNIENIVSEKFSFNFNIKDFLNRFTSLPITQTEGLVEHRVVVQPSLSFYPLFALHGFYANVGCGVLLYFDNYSYSTVSQVNGQMQLFPDVKMGFQSIDAANIAWNVYIGSGLFIPKKVYNAIPVFEVGMKFGIKL